MRPRPTGIDATRSTVLDGLGKDGGVTQDGLLTVAAETERYVSAAGWDQPPRLFALVPTRELAQVVPGLSETDAVDDAGLSAVEQENLPASDDLEGMLAQIAWPAAVVGAAISVERLVVPPEAERDLPQDPAAAKLLRHGEGWLAAHPERKDVRLLVAIHQDGRHIALLRQRDHDADNLVGTGPDLAPGLTQALLATFAAR